jgi:uncharacterized protein (TIGR03086 family)
VGLNPVDGLAEATTVVDGVIAGVHDDQWEQPTPCPDWNVRELVLHIVAGNYLFARALHGELPEPVPTVNTDALLAFRSSASAVVAAFGEPGALERMVTVPFGTVPGIVALHLRVTELLVHGWDVAQATSQHPDFPEDLAEQELAFSRDKLGDIPPGRRPFAPPQPVDAKAPAIDRLVACLGRDVTAEAKPL